MKAIKRLEKGSHGEYENSTEQTPSTKGLLSSVEGCGFESFHQHWRKRFFQINLWGVLRRITQRFDLQCMGDYT